MINIHVRPGSTTAHAVVPAAATGEGNAFASLFPDAPSVAPELPADYKPPSAEEIARQTLSEAVKKDKEGHMAVAHQLYTEAAGQYFAVMQEKKDIINTNGDPVGVHTRAVASSI